MSLNPAIDFSHRFVYSEGRVKRSYVLVIEIRRSLRVHNTNSGEVLLRVGAQNVKLAPAKVQDLMRAKGMVSEEDSFLSNVRTELIIEGRPLRNFLQHLKTTKKDPYDFVVSERLIDENTLMPTLACAVLFAENPSAIVPRQCAVRIVRYDSSHEEVERDSLTDDQHLVEGPLREQIEVAFRTLKKVLGRCMCWSSNGLSPVAYPDDALFELLVNSVLHRDYGVSDNVLISVNRNRVEFRSPGRLPGYVTVDNIESSRFSRNSKLVRLLSKYPDAQNKDLGEGINTVFERMRQAGYVDPIFRDDGTNVYVTLKREPRSEPAQVITNFIEQHGFINNRQALDLLAMDSPEQVTSLFGKLRDQGLIIRENEDDTGLRVKWVLVNKRGGLPPDLVRRRHRDQG
jgi:ATP-dependent DNA helicase RecG